MFNLPKTTVVDKIIPKVKFYEKTKANSKLKQLFIDDIEQIIWKILKFFNEVVLLRPK